MGREESKNMSGTEAVQTWVIYFQSYQCLSSSVCSEGTWEKSRLLTLKMSLVSYCENSSIPLFYFSYTVWSLGRE